MLSIVKIMKFIEMIINFKCKIKIDKKTNEEFNYTVNQCEISSIMFTIK